MSETGLKPGVPARLIAASILGRVLRAGAWSNVALRDIDLVESNDRALVRMLVYETIRKLEIVDAGIAAVLDRPIAAVEATVLDTIRIATTEIYFSRSPNHAAVDTAVEAVKASGNPRAAGFVNGVLRAVGGSNQPEIVGGLGAAFGMPDWLTETLVSAWGEGETIEFFSESAKPAPLAIRQRPGEDVHALAVPGPVAGSWILPAGTDLPANSAVQDPASVAVVSALHVEAGHRVLDLAAAPGGKTLHLGDAKPSLLVASDIHWRRLKSTIKRLDDPGVRVHWTNADALAPPFSPGSFDRILLDAPCSGLGTLRRRPEIRLKVTQSEVARLATQQRRMLEASLPLLAPGGRLVYSVCTVTPAETLDVVEGLGARAPDSLPGRRGETGVLLGPHLSETDGMFISVFDT